MLKRKIKNKTHKFYQNLGKLFYATAATDKKGHPSEFNKLKELVKKQWLFSNPIEDKF